MKLNTSPSGAPSFRNLPARSDCIKPLISCEPRIPPMFAGERRKIRFALFGMIRAENGLSVRSVEHGANLGGIAATLIMITLRR
jgi:hypothetical protein